MEAHQLSSANWNISDKAEMTAILRPGALINGGWTQTQLNNSGIYIRKVLRALDP
jgi:endoglucanase